MELIGYRNPWFGLTSRQSSQSHQGWSPFGFLGQQFPQSSSCDSWDWSDDDCQQYCGCSECSLDLRRQMQRYRPKLQGNKCRPRDHNCFSQSSAWDNNGDKSRQFGGSLPVAINATGSQSQSKPKQLLTSTDIDLKQAAAGISPNDTQMVKEWRATCSNANQVDCQLNVNDKEHNCSCVADRAATEDARVDEGSSTSSADEVATDSSVQDSTLKTDKGTSSRMLSERDTTAENSRGQVDDIQDEGNQMEISQISKRDMHTTSEIGLTAAEQSETQVGSLLNKCKQTVARDLQRCTSSDQVVSGANLVNCEKEDSQEDLLEVLQETAEMETEKCSSDIEDVFDKLQEIMSIVGDVGKHRATIATLSGSRKDRNYLVVEDCLVKALLALDHIESGNHQEVRFARKAAVKYIQKMLEDIEC
ncbi:uncharacterized protein LOC134191928 [Corticium candelabrum]|uniref:uncharacterized protein LOC134191928 n=1 Tax=Corticium candelabrum TaxID=121492 RepID=UPI002E26B6E9|nr:uncharacterized protein LOC134191928 [Corticium candelabrum]